MIKGLTHVALRVTDIGRSIDFYLKIPGITEQFTLKAEDESVILVYLKVADRQFIELFPGADGEHVPPSNSGCVHFCLEVDDIHTMYKSVIENGLTPNGEPFLAIDNTWQFWVTDPDGNPIEFHQFDTESMQLQD